jgi:hypothetical protein
VLVCWAMCMCKFVQGTYVEATHCVDIQAMPGWVECGIELFAKLRSLDGLNTRCVLGM